MESIIKISATVIIILLYFVVYIILKRKNRENIWLLIQLILTAILAIIYPFITKYWICGVIFGLSFIIQLEQLITKRRQR